MKKEHSPLRNAEAGLFVNRAKVSEEYAKVALLKVAEYLRNGEPLPPALAEYLADAIESAMKMPGPKDHDYTPSKSKGRALAVALGLGAHNQRPKTYHDPALILYKVQVNVDAGMSQNEAIKKAADGFGVSPSTIGRIIRGEDAKPAPEGD